MCGIAGLVLDRPLPRGEHLLTMARSLRHRGPDDNGFLTMLRDSVRVARNLPLGEAFEVGLAHRRLAILELTNAGWQPMASNSGRYYLIHNGEVYNFLELREILERKGYRFRGYSDTEVVLNAWEEWGAQALSKFVGMFAFALLDVVERRLYLARDFFGIKPLYFAQYRDGLAFASEIPPLLDLPGVSKKAFADKVYAYLVFGTSDDGEQTMFADVQQVPAGHYAVVNLDAPRQVELVRYWEWDLPQPLEIGFEEAAQRLRDTFLESVDIHMRSDVPVGSALSGGMDSSAIVMGMRRLRPDKEIHAFGFVADDARFSEERFMEVVSKAANIVLHKVRVSPQELLDDFGRLVRLQGEPFVSMSTYAQYRVFRAAEENGIKVMLDGQGADELFGGYVYYKAARALSLLENGDLKRFLSLLLRLRQYPNYSEMLFYLADYLLPRNERFRRLLGKILGRGSVSSWLRDEWFKERITIGRPQEVKAGRGNRLRAKLLSTMTQATLPRLLRYEDRNSMAHSVESRLPFLNPSIAKFALSLPEEFIISPTGTTKAVFREAMRGIVPHVILDRRDKIGFVVPQRRWWRETAPYFDNLLSVGEANKLLPFVDFGKMRREWNAVLAGRRSSVFRMWRGMNLLAWTVAFGVEHE